VVTLYGAKGSGAAAVEAALRIANVPFRWVEAASWEPGPGLEELKRVNPLAQIPTLALEDGTVMTESAAILIWLELVEIIPDNVRNSLESFGTLLGQADKIITDVVRN
jgi:GST-like protein